MADNGDIFGPNGTETRGFREFLHATCAAGQAGATQAYNLPDITKMQSFGITSFLSPGDQWESWHATITTMLASNRLHNVIDWSKPKPEPRDVNAQRWFDASLKVKAWLLNCVNWELIREVEARGKPIDFAHEFMRELCVVVNGEGNAAMQKAYFAVERCRRNHFKTVTKYLTEMRRRLRTALDLGVPITPWMVWIKILDELSKIPSLDSDLAFYRHDMNVREIPTDLTLMEVSGYMTTLNRVVVNRGLDKVKVVNKRRSNPEFWKEDALEKY
ncbi:hypothetical protein N7541_005553 [Penicillium brevicompactum]|uniref:Uncharacterized protein n=1 Tax=Penicillium brevicompactum TaxID=5074 RepID=A0A9W9R8B5_PENBR|nr:hypothetical protein N7541_005553 [Penicillium brevicompactum]